jgi:predicted metal-binding protein
VVNEGGLGAIGPKLKKQSNSVIGWVSGLHSGQEKIFMKRVEPRRLSELIEIALKSGATAARIIPFTQVVIDERVRLKCEVPRCAGYGQFLTCPPHVMPVETFKRILSGYKWALLVQVEAKDIDSTDKGRGRINQNILMKYRDLHRPFKLKLLEIVEAVESAAFKKGMRFAAGLVGGSCVLCERCVDDKSSHACRHPFRARPPMEAVGIDVIKTAQNAGLPIHLSSSENVVWTGLVLLE